MSDFRHMLDERCKMGGARTACCLVGVGDERGKGRERCGEL
jgi:hypothetical protein